jgi:hypothetical protein
VYPSVSVSVFVSSVWSRIDFVSCDIELRVYVMVSLSVCVSICLCVSVCLYLSVYLSDCVSICLSACVFVCVWSRIDSVSYNIDRRMRLTIKRK